LQNASIQLVKVDLEGQLAKIDEAFKSVAMQAKVGTFQG
jgi:hypothetical protein